MNEEKKEKYESNVCPICGRPAHKESRYCIFNASEDEKTQVEFIESLEEYINRIKEEDKDYDFREFTFVGDIDFDMFFKVKIFKNANFEGVTFSGSANFINTIFKGDTNFHNSKFMDVTCFWSTTFEERADFKGASFNLSTEFDHVFFMGLTDFRDAIFQDTTKYNHVNFNKYANFEEATFDLPVNFVGSIFEKDADFMRATFNNDAIFLGVVFKWEIRFQYATFNRIVSFDHAIFFPGRMLCLNVKKKGFIQFEGTFLENINLILDIDRDVFINFNRAFLRNTKIKRDQIVGHILQEKNKDFFLAKDVYLLLKNNFHNIGRYDDESWAFKKEKDMDRMDKSFYCFLDKYKKYNQFKKILKKSNLLKRFIVKSKIFRKWLFSKKAIEWFNLSVSNFIYQYGENPWRVIRFALIVIFSFALILNLSGIVNSDRTNLIIELLKESHGDEYTLRYLGPILGSFLNCLYSSVVTFTTLGYGDFQPAVGASRFFVSLEAIIGAFTMALFVYTFARRTGGR